MRTTNFLLVDKDNEVIPVINGDTCSYRMVNIPNDKLGNFLNIILNRRPSLKYLYAQEYKDDYFLVVLTIDFISDDLYKVEHWNCYPGRKELALTHTTQIKCAWDDLFCYLHDTFLPATRLATFQSLQRLNPV